MKPSAFKWMMACAAIILVVLFFIYDLGQFLSLSYFKSRHAWLMDIYTHHTLMTLGLYMLIYVTVTALSLPGAAVMTLAGGRCSAF